MGVKNDVETDAAANEALRPYFSGERLYGDDADSDELERWYADEADGYAGLVEETWPQEKLDFSFHALTKAHLYSMLPEKGSLGSVLGIGSAFGYEFVPVIDRIAELTILEATTAFERNVGHVQPTFRRAQVSGDLPFSNGSFDVITCFGVLHHVANVSHVVGECARVLRPGGWLLVREPVVSMGDWRKPRRGLTKRERGVPKALLESIVVNAGLHVERSRFCVFPATERVWRVLGVDRPYNSALAVKVDDWLSRAFSWNYRYHAVSVWQKLRPTCVCLAALKS